MPAINGARVTRPRVMAALVAAIHVFLARRKTWMAATRAAMTFGVSRFNDSGYETRACPHLGDSGAAKTSIS